MLMLDLKILIWKTSELPAEGAEPDVEVKIPAALARWVPRMMAFVPKKTKNEVWGEDVDFKAMFGDLDRLVTAW